jgi:hypothetical protein
MRLDKKKEKGGKGKEKGKEKGKGKEKEKEKEKKAMRKKVLKRSKNTYIPIVNIISSFHDKRMEREWE